mgnify:CR=1 FL=1
MSDRTPTVGGNWKMHTDRASAAELAQQVAGLDSAGVEVAVYVPSPYLLTAREALAGSGVVLGAQDVYHEPEGAFTGEVSTTMLADCGVGSVLVGHSERRHVIGEDDALVNKKARAALGAGLGVVLCVGETLEQREAGETDAINARQVRAGLAGVDADGVARVTIAYEPVWAIGTGRTATPDDAQAAHERLRSLLGELYGRDVAHATRIQYGGSVKPANAAELFAMPDIDGGLIGGASLKADQFAAIIRAAAGTA